MHVALKKTKKEKIAVFLFIHEALLCTTRLWPSQRPDGAVWFWSQMARSSHMCAAKCAYAPMASLASACGGGACMIGRCLRLPYFGRACIAGPWALDGAKGAVPVHALYGQELAQVPFLLDSLCFALCPRHGVPLLDEILSLCEVHGQGKHTWKDIPLVTNTRPA